MLRRDLAQQRGAAVAALGVDDRLAPGRGREEQVVDTNPLGAAPPAATAFALRALRRRRGGGGSGGRLGGGWLAAPRGLSLPVAFLPLPRLSLLTTPIPLTPSP